MAKGLSPSKEGGHSNGSQEMVDDCLTNPKPWSVGGLKEYVQMTINYMQYNDKDCCWAWKWSGAVPSTNASVACQTAMLLDTYSSISTK